MRLRILLGLVLSLVAPAAVPAQTVTCDVHPFDAYQIAIARGWQFQCNVTTRPPAGIVTDARVWADVARRRVGCRFVTAPLPGQWPPQAEMLWFVNPTRTTLRNGWQVSSYELSGSTYSNQGAALPLTAYFHLNRVGHTFFWRMTRLVLRKNGGVCANALNEAF